MIAPNTLQRSLLIQKMKIHYLLLCLDLYGATVNTGDYINQPMRVRPGVKFYTLMKKQVVQTLRLIRKTQILFMLQHGNSEDNLIRSTPADREVVFIKVWMEENRGRNLPMDFLQSLLVG